MPKQFNDLKIKDSIMEAITDIGYEIMTPIQEESIPVVLEGKDIVAQAPTGTGKTCCFAIPAINMIDINDENAQVLIMCPTRELAIQVKNEIDKLAKYTNGIKTITVYGGQEIQIQLRALIKKPQIIVGTPGRIMDHLRRGTLNIQKIKMLVLDEADEMFNMGFREDIDDILENVTSNHQTVLFSATMPDDIKRIVKNYQKDARHIKTTFEKQDIPNINQYYVEIDESNKINCLTRMIDTYNFKQALVFCRTKRKVDELNFALTSRKYTVESLHGDLKQAGREKVTELFRQGLIRVLIATDIAARGLDITGIDVVFNYDIPDDVEYYIHRIGRTARAGRGGSSYTFVTPKEIGRIKNFEGHLKAEIAKISAPSYKESEKKKIHFALTELVSLIDDSDNNDYIDYLYQFLSTMDSKYDVDQLAAALLKKIVGIESQFGDQGLDLSVKSKKRKVSRDNYSRMFINLGKKDHLSKDELRTFLSKNSNLTTEKISGIDILDTFSFFEIPTETVGTVLNKLNGTSFSNRRVSVELSQKSSGTTKKSGYANKDDIRKRQKKIINWEDEIYEEVRNNRRTTNISNSSGTQYKSPNVKKDSKIDKPQYIKSAKNSDSKTSSNKREISNNKKLNNKGNRKITQKQHNRFDKPSSSNLNNQSILGNSRLIKKQK